VWHNKDKKKMSQQVWHDKDNKTKNKTKKKKQKKLKQKKKNPRHNSCGTINIPRKKTVSRGVAR
jgi:hypothetical protein